MNPYVVIGVYTDNNDSYCGHMTAETPEQAIAISAANMRLEPGAEQLLLVGAIPGQSYLTPASEAGKAMYALDLATR